jgi:hypothetical protein
MGESGVFGREVEWNLCISSVPNRVCRDLCFYLEFKHFGHRVMAIPLLAKDEKAQSVIARHRSCLGSCGAIGPNLPQLQQTQCSPRLTKLAGNRTWSLFIPKFFLVTTDCSEFKVLAMMFLRANPETSCKNFP